MNTSNINIRYDKRKECFTASAPGIAGFFVKGEGKNVPEALENYKRKAAGHEKLLRISDYIKKKTA